MLVVNTVVAQGPIIFVSLAQVDTGEMDFWYQSRTYDAEKFENTNKETYSIYSFNYTLIQELYGSEYNLSPRWHGDCIIGRDIASHGIYGYQYFIDIDKEAEIGIGVDWPYLDLQDDECIVTNDIKE